MNTRPDSLPSYHETPLLHSLFAQIVQGLQLQDNEGAWKYVPYIPGSIVVNTADILSFLTGGWIKSTVHRVVRPPDDQAQFERLGLFYFARAANDLNIAVVDSPVLRRLGLWKPAGAPVKGLEFTRARVKRAALAFLCTSSWGESTDAFVGRQLGPAEIRGCRLPEGVFGGGFGGEDRL